MRWRDTHQAPRSGMSRERAWGNSLGGGAARVPAIRVQGDVAGQGAALPRPASG